MFVQVISEVLDFVIVLILVSMEVSSSIAMAMLAYIFATMGEITAFQVMMFVLSERANTIIDKKAKLMEYAKIEDEFCDHLQLSEVLDPSEEAYDEAMEFSNILNFLAKVGYLCEVSFRNYLKMRKELKPLRMEVKLGWWLSFYD